MKKSRSSNARLAVCVGLDFYGEPTLDRASCIHRGVDRMWRSVCACGWRAAPTIRRPTALRRLGDHLDRDQVRMEDVNGAA